MQLRGGMTFIPAPRMCVIEITHQNIMFQGVGTIQVLR